MQRRIKGIHHGHFTSEFLFPGNPLVDWLPVVRNGERGWKKTRGTEGWLNWTGVVFLTSTHPRELGLPASPSVFGRNERRITWPIARLMLTTRSTRMKLPRRARDSRGKNID